VPIDRSCLFTRLWISVKTFSESVYTLRYFVRLRVDMSFPGRCWNATACFRDFVYFYRFSSSFGSSYKNERKTSKHRKRATSSRFWNRIKNPLFVPLFSGKSYIIRSFFAPDLFPARTSARTHCEECGRPFYVCVLIDIITRVLCTIGTRIIYK